MIYFFCNEKYGWPFLCGAREFSRERGIPVRAIFSDKIRPGACGLLPLCLNGLRTFVRKQILQWRLKIPVTFVRDVNAESFLSTVREGDYGIIGGFNQILSRDTISHFTLLVNFHPSLLPLYRGPVPSYWCIKNGERWTGYTLHVVTERIDEGTILYQEALEISDASTPDELDARIAAKASRVMLRFLDSLCGSFHWDNVTLNAFEFYSVPVVYATFPDASP